MTMLKPLQIFTATSLAAGAVAASALAQDARHGERRRPPPPPPMSAYAHPGPSWDPARNNGFWMNGRWYYGPPPRDYGPAEVRPGHTPWRRGGYLPPYYHAAVVDDYARYRLRRPPYGYRWVYAGGDYMLVAASSGMIFDVVPGR